MKLADYMAKVYEDAEAQMQETFELYGWEDMWSDLCASSVVTGRECGRYDGMGEEQAADCVKDLVFDRGFREAFLTEFGCDIMDDNEYDPCGFDCDVRLFCLWRMRDFLMDRYAQMTMFGETGHVELPGRYVR